jgi:hypothetical protein
MTRDDLILALAVNYKVPYGTSNMAADKALMSGKAVLPRYGVNVIMTNAGMPAEYRIQVRELQEPDTFGIEGSTTR